MQPAISENSLEWLGEYRKLIDVTILDFFNERYQGTGKTEPERLFEEAMRHAVLVGGKRLRPILAMLAYEELTGQSSTSILHGLIGIELLHCYTLVHDDLPSMDNDVLRRGQPTVWSKYGEYRAVLVGDALQALWFETLTSLGNLAIIALMAETMGDLGVIRGQIKDMQATEYSDLGSLFWLHKQKTGVLIQSSLEVGAILAKASDQTLTMIREYGEHIGLLFQIRDDILDYEGNTDIIGKTARKDIDQNKGIVHQIGIERAKELLETTLEKAIIIAKELSSDRLGEIAYFVARRKS